MDEANKFSSIFGVVVLGAGGVGKSSLVLRFVKGNNSFHLIIYLLSLKINGK